MLGNKKEDLGSFKDPRGRIYHQDGEIYRTVTDFGIADFTYFFESKFFSSLINEEKLVGAEVVENSVLSGIDNTSLVLKHPKLPFISYPYEWPFYALKDAALLQLELYIDALQHQMTLTDATPYNIQFKGSKPIFIDHLSFVKYKAGQPFIAYNQFCEQYIAPLLMHSLLGVPYHCWYRGNLNGIPLTDFEKLIPFHKKCSFNVFLHVVMHASSIRRASQRKNEKKMAARKQPNLRREAYLYMFKNLHKWVKNLGINIKEDSAWGNYDNTNTYLESETDKKLAFVEEFVKSSMPEVLWDFGCNTGVFSKCALQAGAKSVIGFEFDHVALNKSYLMSKREKLNFLPLYQDLANLSPSNGWNSGERSGLKSRKSADAILALAVIHHIVISKNVPLEKAILFFLDFATTGIIEFIPKQDKMIQEMLSTREDIFLNYDENNFRKILSENATIIKELQITESGRKLFWYAKKDFTGTF